MPPSDGGTFKTAVYEELDLLDDASNKGVFTITVEGVVFRENSDEFLSKAVLQEDFDVTPKCCDAPIGKSGLPGNETGHGSFRYAITNTSNFACLGKNITPDSFGIVINVSGSGGGFLEAIGSKAVIRDRNGNAIIPIICIADEPTDCLSSQNTSNNKPFEKLVAELPYPPKYPGNLGNPIITLKNCTASTCDANKDPLKILPTDGQLLYLAGSTTVFDAVNLNASNLPQNCLLDSKNDLHCAYTSISLANNSNLAFVTGRTSRRIRLYFPQSGGIIATGGPNILISHCKDSFSPCGSPSGTNTTDLSFFGCSLKREDPGCGDQTVKWQGSTEAGGLALFMYAPEAILDISGSVTIGGVLWVNGIRMQGDSYAFVPASGVGDAFVLMGILPGADNTYKDSINGERAKTDFIPMDMVARSTRGFRFF